MAMTEADYLAKASDPTTSGAELEALWIEIGSFTFPLGGSAATRIQHTIAKNPNLTPHLAKQCFGQLSSSLADNPALSLLFLENPTLAEQAAELTLLRMTRRTDSPATILEILTRHSIPQVREAARLHVTLFGEATEEQVRQELQSIPVGGKANLTELHSWGLVPGWLATHHKIKTMPPQLPKNNLVLDPNPLTASESKWIQELLQLYMAEPTRPPFGTARESGQGWAMTLCKVAVPLDVLVLTGDWDILLLRSDTPENLKPGLIAESSRWKNGLVGTLARAACLSGWYLHEEALSTRWIRRLGAALNPRLTEKDQKRLMDDANAIVRAVARDSKLRDRIMDYGCDGAV
ncbi:hypothetical protein [Armatimonas rosea]|uniref:Uncharacterized protein n=1 Tax=Armatimonas rosea TaxID=685828 RepID=A0A7W9W9M6_ARMRO|nr:hypothetical protein [Armatimonas rosea]MBB6053461.1 hypothetical protein [Armatimonas rosea]